MLPIAVQYEACILNHKELELTLSDLIKVDKFHINIFETKKANENV